ISMKSPKSLFSELDFYTVYDSRGNRILELEHILKSIEDKFIVLRDKKLLHHRRLTPDDRRTIALFVATMFAGTKRQKEEDVQIWQEYLEMVETLPPAVAKKIKSTPEYKHVVEQDSKQPMPFHLFYFVNITAPYLYSMNCAIYETKTEPGLITSDNPCFWFDPSIYDSSAPITYFGIGSPTLNILFPASPKQYISLQKNGPDGYFDLSAHPDTELELVNLINGFTATNCDNFIVVKQNKYNEKWFDENYQ
ncbi:MAG: DUF4238 domain-containing protein, partial [Chloroflexi bacterium]|nr:DUF4238 domain-containing protein [Chloroflexota bacterium]